MHVTDRLKTQVNFCSRYWKQDFFFSSSSSYSKMDLGDIACLLYEKHVNQEKLLTAQLSCQKTFCSFLMIP